MRIRIVCYEDANSWILGSLATSLKRELVKLGLDAVLADRPDPRADINHHIIFAGFNGVAASLDTLMITHVDTREKVVQVAQQLLSARMGICLSEDTMEKLSLLGVPRNRLCFVNYPSPQVGAIPRRKTHVGLASRIYTHGSKREYMLGELADHLEPDDFAFHIMGQGWDLVVEQLRARRIEVHYQPAFDTELYRRWWQNLDYYLYLGQDEGSTGLLDALAAGVPTIATPQGFHLELGPGLVHAFNDFEELVSIFRQLAHVRSRLRQAVQHLNWEEYARRHLNIWQALLNERTGSPRFEVSQQALDEVGAQLNAPTAEVRSTWLSGLPSQSGPGGAAHRPRVLLLVDEPVAPVVALWSALAEGAPAGLRVRISQAGAPNLASDALQGGFLEIKILDVRSLSTAEWLQLSYDFDAVAFWKMTPCRLARELQCRTKVNYILPMSIAGAPSASADAAPQVVRRSMYAAIQQLRTRSRTRMVAFLMQHPSGLEEPIEAARLAEFCARLDALYFSDPGWSRATTGRATRKVLLDSLENGSTRGARQLLFETLFEVVRRPLEESPTPALAAFRKLGVVTRSARRLLRKKP
jgi:hypothetical protein